MQTIRIPSDRVAVAIGKDGEVKKTIETKGRVKLDIKADGEIIITGEPVDEWKTREVLRAIGRGFNPQVSCLLFDEEIYYKEIDLREIVGKDKQVIRIKGRIIGRNGRTREIIEELTDAKISIYGDTIGIIGRLDEIEGAQEAIEKLIKGLKHATVYSFLERRRRDIKHAEASLWIQKPSMK